MLLYGNLDEIQLLLRNNLRDVVRASETWLKGNVYDAAKGRRNSS